MALFIRRQDNENQLFKVTRDVPAQSTGPNDEEGFITLIIGLGNIGKEFESTRHNSGFMTVDAYAKENSFPAWQEKPKFKAFISEDFVAGKKIVLAKPTTLYNLSGESVRALKDFYKLSNKDIIVVHDELDLPFGTVKEKQGGGSAGSNGLKSIITHIGEDFKRIRIGIKNDLLERIDAADFVLAKFSSTEKKQLDDIIKTALEKL
jgi:PTH1 family peptidyl-tRNA hydrolase